jgi:glycosyltransferase involved in cell wall biosynthesis
LFKRQGYRLVFDTAVDRAVKIIVPSQSVKKELVGFYKISSGKVSVTYEGVSDLGVNKEAESLFEKYKIKKPYFIFTGNAYPHKNLKRLVEAILALNAEREEKVMLLIVSARNFFIKKLEGLISELGAGAYVKILGFLPDSEVGTLYMSSSAFVFPTLSEGFGIPGLDAFGAGTLVLASEIPVLKEIYKEHAIYFNPFDFSSIAKAMEYALSMTSQERAARIAESHDFVKRYSWNKMAQETLAIYEDCASLR